MCAGCEVQLILATNITLKLEFFSCNIPWHGGFIKIYVNIAGEDVQKQYGVIESLHEDSFGDESGP